jgi:hypothetical protein
MSGNILNNTMSSILGGGIPGIQSKKIYDKNSENNYSRLFLRQSFGNSHLSSSIGSPLNLVKNGQSKTTPFRAIMAAGDVNGTVNSGPSSQLSQYSQINSSSIQSVRAGKGGVKNGNAYYSGNPRFVYDGSDYIKYKKLRALLSSYDKK